MFLKPLKCRYLSHRQHGNHRNTRIPLVLENGSRHHSSHDLHVNVWSYRSLVMRSLSGYEDLDLRGSDQFSFWCRISAEGFLGSLTFQVPTSYLINYSAIGRGESSLHLVALCFFLSRRTSSRLCHCVMIVCAPLCTF